LRTRCLQRMQGWRVLYAKIYVVFTKKSQGAPGRRRAWVFVSSDARRHGSCVHREQLPDARSAARPIVFAIIRFLGHIRATQALHGRGQSAPSGAGAGAVLTRTKALLPHNRASRRARREKLPPGLPTSVNAFLVIDKSHSACI
jgi:hypothetical protein